MKNSFFFLSILFLTLGANAQESVPLFDEIPVFEENAASKNTDKEGILMEQPKQETPQKEVSRPNLGRNAVPLTSLRLAPFPDVTVDLDPSLRPPVQEKKFEEKVISEDDILKRSTPLTMTEKSETADAYLQRLIDERRLKIAAGAGKYQNPLGLRYDVDGFLIASIGLGMMPDEVEDILQGQDYILTKVDKTIPPSLSVQYEKDCRLTKKLYVPAEIRACIFDMSQEEETRYIKKMTFERVQSRETIEVDFTSLATENLSYRISYKSKGDSSLGSSYRHRMMKENRKKEFWNLVFAVYGLPDDNEKVIWGNENTSFFKAKMQGSAYDAYLTLESSQLQNEDYFKWEDSLNEMQKITTFHFVSQEDIFDE